MGKGDTLLNAVVGAVVTVVLSFVGISPVIGGGVAAYLQRGDRRDGVRVGAISGAIATVPFVLLAVFVFGSLLGVGIGGAGPPGAAGLFGGVLVAALLAAVVWNVVLAALGGLVAWYLLNETGETDDGAARSL